MGYKSVYIGPLGALVELPIDGDINVEPVEKGALSESLDGTRTKDVFAYRRSFEIGLPRMTPSVVSLLEMWQQGYIRPLRLLDPQRPNRLPAEVSACGQVRWTAPLVTAAGQVGVSTDRPPVLTPTSYGWSGTPAPQLSALWTPSANGVLSPRSPIPVLPGETVYLEAWVLRSGQSTVSAQLVPYSATGVAGAVAAGAAATAAGWSQVTVAYTVPASGVVASVLPQLAVTSPATGATITTAAWHLGTRAGAPWHLGFGVPTVDVAGLPQTRSDDIWTLGTLQLVEAA